MTAAMLAGGTCPAARAALTAGGIGALDGTGSLRDAFSNVETIALRQQVNNSAASDEMIRFKFTVYNPAGGAVFRHEGNSTRGVPGNSNSQVALPISRFYGVPGVYRFTGEAALGTDAPVVQTTQFSISSPNINLIYPPYGARDLTDKPLTFRWVASGASSYKITVSASIGLYDPLQTGTAASGMFTYPENPSQDREKLVPDKVYYWKVEGLDETGAKISESSVYNFSLKSQASSQSRNVAVTALDLTDQKADFKNPLHFRAVVQNTGGTNEASIEIKMSLSGVPAQDSPKHIGMFNAGEQREIPFTAFMPTGQDQGLAVACVDIFDDNIPDNCKTKLIAKDTGSAVAPSEEEDRKLSYQEIWDEVLKRLGPEAAKALEGYTFDSIDCPDCSAGELNDLMLALINGEASLTGAAVLETSPTGSALTAPVAGTVEAEPEEKNELLADLMPQDRQKQDEWSGYTGAVKAEAPVSYIVKSAKEWEKAWKLISTEEPPEVDFEDKMVVGIVAGSGSRADTVRILSSRRKGDVVIFDYYITQSSAETYFVPYIFKVVEKVYGAVEFLRIDVGGK